MKQRCYFHKNQPIQHFCTLKQCTLPLCDQCLQIHQQQHLQKNQSSNVISYQEAYEEVQQTLSNFLKQNEKAKQKSLQRLNNDKLKAIRAVEEYFAQFQTRIQEESKLLLQIQQKIEKIKKGSIKTVIYYYSGDITLRQLHFPQIQQISSSILKCIHDVSISKKEQIQTFRQDINIQREKDKQKQKENERERGREREREKQKEREKAHQELNIQTYQSKTKSGTKKRLIFSNDKVPTPTHKNTNGPYTQNQKKQQKTPYQAYQREKTRLQSQRSQVKNYFHNQNLYREESFNPNTAEMFPIPTMKQRQEIKILRQNPVVSNVDFRNLRSKTLDKFPSMAQLTMARENTYTPLRKEEEKTALERYNGQFKPGKWNKNKYDQQSNLQGHQRQESGFSQFTLNQNCNQINNRVNTQFTNRRPLKTTDLETYSPLTNVMPPASIQSRQRAASFEVGLRNTVSHNNLQAGGKKMEPLLGDELKKQVLSPLEIRKMLQKKIEERNKVLSQKKQFQLKISTDRVGAVNNVRPTYDMGTMNEVNKVIENNRQRVSRTDNLEMENIRRQVPAEQRSSMYNTKDTIINQIYRETRY